MGVRRRGDGNHVVELDPTSLGAGQVPLREFPLTVTAERGKTARVEIGMVRGAQLSGTIDIRPALEHRAGIPGANLAASSPLGNVVVELTGAGKTLTRMSDANGRFDFSDLVPGRWTLKPNEGSLSRCYYFDCKALDVDLAPGGAVEFALDVVPLERRVRILERVEVPVQQER